MDPATSSGMTPARRHDRLSPAPADADGVLVAVMSRDRLLRRPRVGDPVWLLVNPQMDQKDIEAAVRALGLDRPIWEQYLHFVSGALRGDLGRSFIFGEPALTVILQRMPATLELALRRPGDGRSPSAFRSASTPASSPSSWLSQDHHGRLDRRLQPADVLGRADADHGVRGHAGLAALDRARRRRPPISASPPASSRSTACATSCCRRSTWRCSRSRW